MIISRRDFLKNAAIGTAGIALLGSLPGCSENTQVPAETTVTKSDVPDVPIETLESDIVVVGSGMGGMAASISAAEKGAHVILLEKAGILGGGTNHAEVMFGYGSRFSKEMGIEYTKFEILKNEFEFHNYYVDTTLWERIVDVSGDCIDWFLDKVEPHGGGFFALLGNEGGLKVAHAFKPTQVSTKGLGQIVIMEEIARDLGVQIYTNYAAKEILMSDGAVSGVLVNTKKGTVQIKCKAVILATGGYAGNSEILKAHNRDMSQMAMRGCSTCTGDGMAMAHEVGAVERGSSSIQLLGASMHESIGLDTHINQATCNEPFAIWVNQDGVRYMPEGELIFTQAANAIDMQDATYAVFDSAQAKRFTTYKSVAGYGTYILPDTVLDKVESDIKELLDKKVEFAFTSDTIEGLADKMSIPTDAFAKTVSQYNEICKQGTDVDFGKRSSALNPISTPPYYGFKLYTNLLCTLGGIRINKNGQALDKNSMPIKGLYATGCDAGGFTGDTYGVNLPGSTQALALCLGRLSALHAVGSPIA